MLWGNRQVTQGTFGRGSFLKIEDIPPAASDGSASDAVRSADPCKQTPLSQKASENTTLRSAQRRLPSSEDDINDTWGRASNVSTVTTPRAVWGEEGELVQGGLSIAGDRPNNAGEEQESGDEAERERSRIQCVTPPGGAGSGLTPLLDTGQGVLREEKNLTFGGDIPGRSAFGRPSTQVPYYPKRGSRCCAVAVQIAGALGKVSVARVSSGRNLVVGQVYRIRECAHNVGEFPDRQSRWIFLHS